MDILINDDMDLGKIAESGQCFRWRKLDTKTWGIPLGARFLCISDEGEGRFLADCTSEEFESVWSPYFDLHTDYRSIRKAIPREKDPFLFKASESEAGIRILRQDLWETLISFIISQNRNIPAIKRSIELLCQLAGSPITDLEEETVYSFPTPEAIVSVGKDGLASCALGYRDAYIIETAERVASGDYSLERLSDCDDDDSLEYLMSLKGVGKKVASCVQLFGLHRMDAFPIDVWVKRILENEYPQGYPMDSYHPWNGVYQQYMFAYYRKL